MATFKDGEFYSTLGGHQPVVYAVTQIPLHSLQCCRDFQTRKLGCNITSLIDKPTDVNALESSLTI